MTTNINSFSVFDDDFNSTDTFKKASDVLEYLVYNDLIDRSGNNDELKSSVSVIISGDDNKSINSSSLEDKEYLEDSISLSKLKELSDDEPSIVRKQNTRRSNNRLR